MSEKRSPLRALGGLVPRGSLRGGDTPPVSTDVSAAATPHGVGASTPAAGARASNAESSASAHLHFAPEAHRVRRTDLPPDFDADDIYRGLDQYLEARRIGRREARRIQRRERQASARSPNVVDAGVSTAPQESQDDAQDDSGSDSDSSSSSSASVAAYIPGISRLRALFGDSDSSSSSSSSDASDSEDDSSSFVSEASRRSHGLDVQDHASVAGSGIRRRRPSSVHASGGRPPEISESPAPFSPWTPRLGALTGPRRRRPRRRHRRHRRPEEDNALRMNKPSRKARRNARRLREIAGGVTEYTLFAPTGSMADAVVQSRSWRPVQTRLDDYFQYHAQVDAHAGDLGRPTQRDVYSVGTDPTDSSAVVDDEVDLALPPPALSLDAPDSEQNPQFEVDPSSFEHEAHTGRHMSDVPLTPYFRGGGRTESITSPMPYATQSMGIGTIPEEPHARDGGSSGTERTPRPARGETPADSFPAAYSRAEEEPWWLDILCPTYKDMQQLGRRFPLHPLTVEDILKQEPREKVETFEGLGYYFVVVRAMDESYFRFTTAPSDSPKTPSSASSDSSGTLTEKPDVAQLPSLQEGPPRLSPRSLESQLEKDSLGSGASPAPSGRGRLRIEMVRNAKTKEGLEGVGVGTVNLYLVVFSHGVLSFHFEDLHKHMERVRSRLLQSPVPIQRNADWIVHGLYDSVIDSIFPFVSFMQTETSLIEHLTNDPNLLRVSSVPPREKKPGFWARLIRRGGWRKASNALSEDDLLLAHELDQEILGSERSKRRRATRFNTLDAMHQSMVFMRLKTAREIVTGLSRVLAPKPDVLRGLRKRLSENHQGPEENAILLYIDDVYDHIASMLAQLHDRDSGLTHAHWIYLARIRFNNKGFVIKASERLLFASSIAFTVLLALLVTSSMSMNLNGLPRKSTRDRKCGPPNEGETEEVPGPGAGDLNAFGVIIVIISFSPLIVYLCYRTLRRLSVIRTTQKQASR